MMRRNGKRSAFSALMARRRLGETLTRITEKLKDAFRPFDVSNTVALFTL